MHTRVCSGCQGSSVGRVGHLVSATGAELALNKRQAKRNESRRSRLLKEKI